MKGSVYFILDPDKNHVKIGFTTKGLGERLRQLQTGNSARLEVLAWFTDFKGAEQSLHVRFDKLRVDSGLEWFRCDEQLRAYISDVRGRGPEAALI